MKLKHPFLFLQCLNFLFAIQYGLVVYINSSFLETAISAKAVGILFAMASVLSIWVLLEIPSLLSRLGNYKTTILVVLLNSFSLLLLGLVKSNFIIICSFLLYAITNYCLLLVRDVFIEDFTYEKEIGRTRGLVLTFMNMAIVIAPTIAVFIIAKSSYSGVYFLASILVLLSLFFLIPKFKNFKDPKYVRVSMRATFKKISGDANLKKIYLSQFLLCFFYVWMIIYMPIYLHESIGFGWKSIGLIFSIMLIPFVLLDYPLGMWSDKLGEKKILVFGFLIMSISTISIFFIKTPNFFLWATILFISRVGAASIEVMNESYFFKKIKPSDASLISFFRNIFPSAFVIAPLLSTIILFFTSSLEYLFLVLGVFMLLGIVACLKLRDLK